MTEATTNMKWVKTCRSRQTPASRTPSRGGRSAKTPHPGNYCWTHGHRISIGHTSASCSHKAKGHCDEATAVNTLGGNERDKGWHEPRTRREGQANVVYCENEHFLTKNYYYALSTPSACNTTKLHPSQTGIADSGASGFFFAPDAPVTNRNPHAPTMCVRVANGIPEKSVASATLSSVPSLPAEAMQGHVMPSVPNTLIGLGPCADLGYKIVFTKTAVSVIHPDGHSILEGWRELTGPRLWMFPLNPTETSAAEPPTVDPPPRNAIKTTKPTTASPPSSTADSGSCATLIEVPHW